MSQGLAALSERLKALVGSNVSLQLSPSTTLTGRLVCQVPGVYEIDISTPRRPSYAYLFGPVDVHSIKGTVITFNQ